MSKPTSPTRFERAHIAEEIHQQMQANVQTEYGRKSTNILSCNSKKRTPASLPENQDDKIQKIIIQYAQQGRLLCSWTAGNGVSHEKNW